MKKLITAFAVFAMLISVSGCTITFDESDDDIGNPVIPSKLEMDDITLKKLNPEKCSPDNNTWIVGADDDALVELETAELVSIETTYDMGISKKDLSTGKSTKITEITTHSPLFTQIKGDYLVISHLAEYVTDSKGKMVSATVNTELINLTDGTVKQICSLKGDGISTENRDFCFTDSDNIIFLSSVGGETSGKSVISNYCISTGETTEIITQNDDEIFSTFSFSGENIYTVNYKANDRQSAKAVKYSLSGEMLSEIPLTSLASKIIDLTGDYTLYGFSVIGDYWFFTLRDDGYMMYKESDNKLTQIKNSLLNAVGYAKSSMSSVTFCEEIMDGKYIYYRSPSADNAFCVYNTETGKTVKCIIKDFYASSSLITQNGKIMISGYDDDDNSKLYIINEATLKTIYTDLE